jgi:stage V sporulation protein D (sporulation-specific penicillin-binding protein)
VVLTLDVDLQAICERRLQTAVDDFRAVGGSILIVDPHNGDILAAASYPMLEARRGDYSRKGLWMNRNFTENFEPGSIFKIMTTASLLRNAAIDTGTVFDCSNTDASIFYIENDDGHKYGDIGLMRAFALSSNIYFARAVANLKDREFHRDLVDFGFGQKTTLPYPGQEAGMLHDPLDWSARSRPTVAIGQEVMVTPLQLALAVSAAANGGTLYAPRLVREVRDRDGAVLERRPAVPLRRIFSEQLAFLLRQAMAGVVQEGTGRAAQTEWIHLGGKTGTAEKSCEGDVGYTPGAYVASFVGLVPVDEPRFVVLTVIDQPQGYRNYYAAQSALPLFNDVVRDIRQSTAWLADVPGGRTAPLQPEVQAARITVPDVLHLSADRAARTLQRAQLVPLGCESAGTVVEQVPAAGTLVCPGQTIDLTVAVREASPGGTVARCPDFSGLSNRQACRLAASLGLNIEMQGAGFAVAQEPAAGAPLASSRVVLRMEAPWE